MDSLQKGPLSWCDAECVDYRQGRERQARGLGHMGHSVARRALRAYRARRVERSTCHTLGVASAWVGAHGAQRGT